MSKTIFISSRANDAAFQQFCRDQKWNLVAIPLIKFNAIPFKWPVNEDFNWIFFTSKRSVDFFFSIAPSSINVKFACIGKTTENALNEWGLSASFVGKRSGEPDFVASTFSNVLLPGEKVLFPQSSISNQSIQKALSNDQIINLIIYETFSFPRIIMPQPDILVFTSPSNVRSFLQMNEVKPNQTIIAWGDTTAAFLLQSNIQPNYTLSESSYPALLDTLLEMMR